VHIIRISLEASDNAYNSTVAAPVISAPVMTAPVMSAPVNVCPRYDHPWFRLDRANIRGEREGGK